MTSLSRFVVLAGFFLISASAVPAQRFVSGGYSGYGGYGYSGGGDFGRLVFQWV
jgi:hypothetical protein